MARVTVADVLLDGLGRAGVARVFSASGAAALLKAAARRGLDVVDAQDPTAAAVLAAVSGEVGEGPGALIAGPGDTAGLVRGLAHAQRERAPLVAVTPAGADAGLLAPVVKASLIVEPASAGHSIAHAAHLAMGSPRGPVHLIVDDAVAGEPAVPVAARCRPGPLPPPEPAALDSFATALTAASRPLLVTGLECGGDDVRWIRALAETLPAPVLATAKGRGTLAEPHPLSLGLLGPDHPLLSRADPVVLVGVDAGELPPGALPARGAIARIGRAPWPDGDLRAEVVGDLALVIEELAPAVRARAAADWDVAELDRLKRTLGSAARATPSGRLVALAREASPAGTLVAGDVAALAAWQAVAPREILTPLGPPPAGWAVLAAVAAQLQHRDRRVVAFTPAPALADAAGALRLASDRGLPLVVVALGALAGDGLERAGLATIVARGEPEFATAFSQAWQGGSPAVIAVDLERV
jgi:thiamine pyrophosphate-dependent acetolactate synthase large subunit-like protein